LNVLALRVHKLLCREYDCPIPYFHSLDPLSELVSSLLSHRTKNADSGRAFKQLRAVMPTWDQVRDAPEPQVRALIAPATWPEQKAPRIQQVLRLITQRTGSLSLDFLADWTEDAGRQWLESMPGVGPKTSAAVLSFSTLRKAALPVDSHHHRVAMRLGLIPPNTAVGPSHELLAAQLPKGWSAQQVYDNHEVMMLHGQRCCFPLSPECSRCVLKEICPTGRVRLGIVETPPETVKERMTKSNTIKDPNPPGHASEIDAERKMSKTPAARRGRAKRDAGPTLFPWLE
jgi:endonuclease-3